MSEGGLVPAFIQSPTRSTTKTKDETTQLATPPPSQSPPDMSPLSDKSTRQQSNDGGDGREGEDGETITQTSGEGTKLSLYYSREVRLGVDEFQSCVQPRSGLNGRKFDV